MYFHRAIVTPIDVARENNIKQQAMIKRQTVFIASPPSENPCEFSTEDIVYKHFVYDNAYNNADCKSNYHFNHLFIA